MIGVNNTINKKEFHEIFYIAFILIPYLKPYNITLVPSVNSVFKMWKILATVIVICTWIYKKAKIHVPTVSLLCFLAIWIVSLVMNRKTAQLSELINNILSIAGCAIFFEIGNHTKEFEKNLCTVLYRVFTAYFYLNLITVFMKRPFFSDGMVLEDNANFLGGDNYSAFIIIAMSGIVFFCDLKKDQTIRKRTFITTFAGLLGLCLTFSLTGMAIDALFLFLATTRKNCFLRKAANWKIALFIAALVVLSISYLHLDRILAAILKSMDKTGFNGRGMIWPMVISAILKKPILGYGGVNQYLAQTWFIAGANHAHNILLEYPFSTGLLGTMFFISYLYSVMNRQKKSSSILKICVSCYFLCSIFDFYIGLIYLYLLLDMIYFEDEKLLNE